MNTNELIALLAADQAARRWRIEGVLLGGLALGALLAALGFHLGLSMRSDMDSVIETPRVALKFVMTLGLLVAGMGLARRLACPGLSAGAWRFLPPLLGLVLLGGVLAELAVVPPALWGARLMGQNALYCLSLIPALAAGPFLCLMLALRQGAATRPAMAGAVAGLAAGGMGAALYALHCVDDSPLFLATWYGIAIGGMTLLGALLGRRWLRW